MARDSSGQAEWGRDETWGMSEDEIKALKKAIKDAGPAARAEMRGRLKGAGEIVQHEIQSRTPVYGGRYRGKAGKARRVSGSFAGKTYKQTHSPGLLKKSTKLKVGRAAVKVYNDAVAKSAKYPGGYRYGKRLEFDPKFAGEYAFFYPGYESVQHKAQAEFDKVLQAAADAYMKK